VKAQLELGLHPLSSGAAVAFGMAHIPTLDEMTVTLDAVWSDRSTVARRIEAASALSAQAEVLVRALVHQARKPAEGERPITWSRIGEVLSTVTAEGEISRGQTSQAAGARFQSRRPRGGGPARGRMIKESIPAPDLMGLLRYHRQQVLSLQDQLQAE
jgi:hypothetical protein